MALNRAQLLAKMRVQREQERVSVKKLDFLLPDDRSPQWNPLSLLAKADWLMVEANVSDALRFNFKSEAMEGDFRHILETIEEWFSITIKSNEVVPLEGSILQHYDDQQDAADAADQWEMESDLINRVGDSPIEDEDATMDQLEARQAEQTRREEAQRKAEEMIRRDLGLHDDETVIVRVVRRPAPGKQAPADAGQMVATPQGPNNIPSIAASTVMPDEDEDDPEEAGDDPSVQVITTVPEPASTVRARRRTAVVGLESITGAVRP